MRPFFLILSSLRGFVFANGVAAEKGLLKQWPKEGPKLVLQLKDIGSGYSTPSVVGDRLYLMSNEGMDNEFVFALQTSDGQRAWSTSVGKVGTNDGPQYPGAGSAGSRTSCRAAPSASAATPHANV